MRGADPRLSVLRDRLRGVRRVIAVVSSKGGVGKTLVATSLALAAARRGLRVGLLDTDFTNPTAHIALGADISRTTPREEKGVVPPTIHGVEFMTIAFYSGENPLPLRGEEIDEVFLELLAITRWGELDLLLIDTPPGVSNELLDLLSYVPNVENLVATTPSPLSLNSLRRLLKMMLDAGEKVLGVVANMATGEPHGVAEVCRSFGVDLIEALPLDPEIDLALGNPDKMLSTVFGRAVDRLLEEILRKPRVHA